MKTHRCSPRQAQHRRLYEMWKNMRKRCRHPEYPGNEAYAGVTVCAEWESFEAFMSWAIANGYSDRLVIDRINTELGYEPDNCRFVTPSQNTIRANEARVTPRVWLMQNARGAGGVPVPTLKALSALTRLTRKKSFGN